MPRYPKRDYAGKRSLSTSSGWKTKSYGTQKHSTRTARTGVSLQSVTSSFDGPEGSRAKEHVQVPDPTETSGQLDGKVVLVPIAVPGCGTYLCISLSHL